MSSSPKVWWPRTSCASVATAEAFDDWARFVAEARNSPEAVAKITGVPAQTIRGAARLYATGGNGAIYYGLGVTEHSQGSTAVMAIANLAMATGNIGRPGVGVNPLRGQNNVQGSCDMGSFPHELPGYRHVANPAVRAIYENEWGVTLDPEPGLRIPNMLDAARRGLVPRHLHPGRGHRAVRSRHQARHRRPGGDGMRRGARPVPERNSELRARVPAGRDVPGKGRHVHQRRTPHQPGAQGDGAARRHGGLGGDAGDRQRHGLPDGTTPIRRRSWTRSRAPRRRSPAYRSRSWTEGSVQWPCNDEAPEGTPIMHIDGFVRGKGNFIITEYVPTDEKVGPRFPLLLTTGRILSQYNVGAQTRRTANVVWHPEDVLEIHPHDAEERGVRDGDWVRLASRVRRDDAARARHRSRGAGRRLHDVPSSGDAGERGHHRLFRLGDELSGIQGDRGAGLAVERAERVAGRVPRADRAQPPDRGGAGEVSRTAAQDNPPPPLAGGGLRRTGSVYWRVPPSLQPPPARGGGGRAASMPAAGPQRCALHLPRRRRNIWRACAAGRDPGRPHLQPHRPCGDAGDAGRPGRLRYRLQPDRRHHPNGRRDRGTRRRRRRARHRIADVAGAPSARTGLPTASAASPVRAAAACAGWTALPMPCARCPASPRPPRFDAAAIHAAMAALPAAQTLNQQTHAVHAAAFWHPAARSGRAARGCRPAQRARQARRRAGARRRRGGGGPAAAVQPHLGRDGAEGGDARRAGGRRGLGADGARRAHGRTRPASRWSASRAPTASRSSPIPNASSSQKVQQHVA